MGLLNNKKEEKGKKKESHSIRGNSLHNQHITCYFKEMFLSSVILVQIIRKRVSMGKSLVYGQSNSGVANSFSWDKIAPS